MFVSMLFEYDDISTIETFAFFMMVAAAKKTSLRCLVIPTAVSSMNLRDNEQWRSFEAGPRDLHATRIPFGVSAADIGQLVCQRLHVYREIPLSVRSKARCINKHR